MTWPLRRIARAHRPTRLLLVAIGLATALAVGPAHLEGQAESSEELAKRWLESGLRFLRDGRAAEGLKDLQRVVDVYPTSAVADDALLEIAEYQLTGNAAPAAARAVVETLIAKYPGADTAPMAYVMAGRVGLAEAGTLEEIDQALANFERVRVLFPRSSAVAASLTYAGDAQRVARRAPEAARFYQRAASEYPRAPWTAHALVGLAAAHAAASEPVKALEALAQAQATFPGSPEAAVARDRATILYRLHLRAPGAPAFAPSERVIAGAGGRLEDVLAIESTADGAIAVLQRQGVTRFDADGRARESVRATDARTMASGRQGQVIVGTRGALLGVGPVPIALALPRPDGAPRPMEDVRALAVSRTGEYLVADGGTRAIARFGADGRHAGAFATVDAVRLAVSETGLVAALERGGKGVTVLDATGRQSGRLAATGRGYALQEAVDVAWDALGYLYVLDRDSGSVIVFAPNLQHVTTYTLPQRHPASFRRATAFALDAAGRLYVHDDRARSIRVHQ